ncbi:MAG: O-antigen ligase family protein, partial [Actinomycetota bacterium]
LVSIGVLARSPPARARRLAAVAALGFVLWNALAFLLAGPDRRGFYGEPGMRQGLWAMALSAVAWWLGSRAFAGTQERRALLRAAKVATGAVALLALWGVVSGTLPTSGLFEGRATATLGQPNSLGAFLGTGVPLATALAFVASDRRERLLAALAAVLALAGILASGSRGALLGLAVAAVVGAVALRGRLRVDARVLRRGAVAVAAATALLLAIPAVRDVVGATLLRATSIAADARGGSVTEHLDLWTVAAHVIADHPLVGIGHERFPEAFAAYRDRVLSPERAAAYVERRAESPHDVLLAIAVAAGLPALALYLALVGVGLAGLLRGRRGDPDPVALPVAVALGLALVVHLVTDLFMTADLASMWFGWLLLGAGAASAGAPAGPVDRP